MSEQASIADLFISHFTAAFTSAHHCIHPEVLASIPLVMQNDQNHLLCDVPTFDEIKRTVFTYHQKMPRVQMALRVISSMLVGNSWNMMCVWLCRPTFVVIRYRKHFPHPL